MKILLIDSISVVLNFLSLNLLGKTVLNDKQNDMLSIKHNFTPSLSLEMSFFQCPFAVHPM